MLDLLLDLWAALLAWLDAALTLPPDLWPGPT